jgi:hypothetical protein
MSYIIDRRLTARTRAPSTASAFCAASRADPARRERRVDRTAITDLDNGETCPSRGGTSASRTFSTARRGWERHPATRSSSPATASSARGRAVGGAVAARPATRAKARTTSSSICRAKSFSISSSTIWRCPTSPSTQLGAMRLQEPARRLLHRRVPRQHQCRALAARRHGATHGPRRPFPGRLRELRGGTRGVDRAHGAGDE